MAHAARAGGGCAGRRRRWRHVGVSIAAERKTESWKPAATAHGGRLMWKAATTAHGGMLAGWTGPCTRCSLALIAEPFSVFDQRVFDQRTVSFFDICFGKIRVDFVRPIFPLIFVATIFFLNIAQKIINFENNM